MEHRQTIEKLNLLKSITPRQDWVFSVKSQVMSQIGVNSLVEPRILQGSLASRILGELVLATRYFEKPAFAFAGLMLVVGVSLALQISSSSLPGDPLYSVKSTREQVEFALSPSKDRAFVQLELAQRRLDELKQVTAQNRTKDLAAAIKGYQSRVSEVSQALPGLVDQEPRVALQAGKVLLELQKERSKLERVLGTSIGEGENDSLAEATRVVVESELKDLETRTLNEEQAALVSKAVAASEAGEYETALEYLLKVGSTKSGD
ncbi:MAG: hypothetical protein HY458_01325 [Parcubacteria group bacterium]|nr:hypothetical protein [Parcubacteria group bacterium]